MKKENKKKITILTIIAVITLIAVVVGATYAYFQSQGGTSSNTNVNVQTSTTDNLSFQIGESISITANQEDFGQGMPNKSGSTTASATLTANNATNSAARNYYVYLDITNNDFVYTTDDNQAELLLKVTGPEGEVTEIPGLTRKISGNETGFDITSYDRLIAIVDNYEITSTGTTTQDWTVEVIFVNLDSDQNANTGKTFNANLIIQEEEIVTNYLSDYIINEVYAGVEGSSGIYYHDGIGEYINADQEAGDNSYRYSGSNDVVNNYVCFGPGAEADGTCANDNLYRIIGLFDDDNNGTYQVKLIKAELATSDVLGTNGDYAGLSDNNATYYWNRSYVGYDSCTWGDDLGSTNWATSELNKINLNTNYWNYLSTTWKELIASTTWHLGLFVPSGNDLLAKEFFDCERSEETYNNYPVTYEDEIAIMYASDYGYAIIPDYWNQNLQGGSYAQVTYNWMNHKLSTSLTLTREWTLSNIGGGNCPGLIGTYGTHGGLYWYYGNDTAAVRPVFYLNSNVEFIDGTGTSSDPFILSIV